MYDNLSDEDSRIREYFTSEFVRSLTPEQMIEHAYGVMSMALFRLREAGRYDDAYLEMGTVMHLMVEDRMELIKSGKVKV